MHLALVSKTNETGASFHEVAQMKLERTQRVVLGFCFVPFFFWLLSSKIPNVSLPFYLPAPALANGRKERPTAKRKSFFVVAFFFTFFVVVGGSVVAGDRVAERRLVGTGGAGQRRVRRTAGSHAGCQTQADAVAVRVPGTPTKQQQ